MDWYIIQLGSVCFEEKLCYPSMYKRVIRCRVSQYSLKQHIHSHFFFYIFYHQTIDLIKIYRLTHNSAWIHVLWKKNYVAILSMRGLFRGWLYGYSKVVWNSTKTDFNWIIPIEIDFSYMGKRNGLDKIDFWEGADFAV